MDFEVMAEGLKFPEGPVAFPDGSVVLVEVFGGRLTRCWGDGRTEVVADLGGGPNGAALGPDGAIWVCNNGGFTGPVGPDGKPQLRGISPPDYEGGRIERVDLATGRFERVFTHCGDLRLKGPNDLVFDRSGGLWFTDFGKQRANDRDFSSLHYVGAGLDQVQMVHDRVLSYNGVGLSPDETTAYVADTYNARVWAYDLEGPGKAKPGEGAYAPARFLAGLPTDARFDSLAMTEAGNVCVATLGTGGITTVTPAGETSFIGFPDPTVTNICFGGPDRRTAFITLSGSGRLIRAPNWPEPGLALNFSQY